MGRKVTLKEVIAVVKLSLFPTWCWPQPQDATQFKMLCVKLYHCLCIIMDMSVAVPLMYTITLYLDEPDILVNVVMMTSSCIHGSFNFLFHMINHHHIRNVTYEMVHFSDLMKPHEEIIVQRHIDKCVMYHGVSIFMYYSITFLAIAVPFLTQQQSFPLSAEYPFNTSYQPLFTIIYIQQSAAGILISAQLCTNVLMALLLWFATARFEILIEDLGKVTNACQLFECIKRHQELLKYAEEVAISARPFALSTLYCSTLCLICIFLDLITDQPIAKMLHFFTLSLAALSEVYMYSWPAEYLMHTSKCVAEAAFHMLENNHFIELRKCLQIVIMRSQKPIEVTIPCLMPPLSLNSFTTYLSTILSYFTTLRVMMDDDKN
ncbi:odorant receptor 43a-like isoform X2 [Temnothorax longispinosus]|uniref:odorant receptor 43a-like isoform X2 n=1 Tax=Temnothorax longispinosus TaxID=300112 RepID=UPI003A98E21F